MPAVRVIARLDIKAPNLVKGVHLEGLRVMGDPAAFARRYYEEGADEIVYMDIVASLYGRNSILELVERTAHDVFVPITVGGGIRTVDDVKAVLRAGADKVSVNTAAVKDPDFIRRISEAFGSQCVVATIEAIRDKAGAWRAFTDNGREKTGLEAVEWAGRLESLGAGEIMVTSVDREGTFRGFDIDLVKRIAASVDIPVIAHGGAGKPADAASAVTDGDADAIAVAGLFHYGRATVADVKSAMAAAGIEVRA
jgi:cyclase